MDIAILLIVFIVSIVLFFIFYHFTKIPERFFSTPLSFTIIISFILFWILKFAMIFSNDVLIKANASISNLTLINGSIYVEYMADTKKHTEEFTPDEITLSYTNDITIYYPKMGFLYDSTEKKRILRLTPSIRDKVINNIDGVKIEFSDYEDDY